MGSEKRAMPKGVFVRLTEQERDWLDTAAQAYDVTPAELVRAVLFERTPRSVVPCSSRHVGCTAHHRNLVDSYDEVHRREMLELEAATGMLPGDIDLWRENGGRLTTFREWIQANAS